MSREYRLGHVNPNESRTVNAIVRSTVPTDEILRDVRDKIIEAKRELKSERRKLIAQRAQMQGLRLDDIEVVINDSGEILATLKNPEVSEDDEGLL